MKTEIESRSNSKLFYFSFRENVCDLLYIEFVIILFYLEFNFIMLIFFHKQSQQISKSKTQIRIFKDPHSYFKCIDIYIGRQLKSVSRWQHNVVKTILVPDFIYQSYYSMGFLTAILHRGLRNYFFFSFLSGHLLFFHILFGLTFPFFILFFSISVQFQFNFSLISVFLFI